MNWFSFHVASGTSLFSGAGLLIFGMLVTFQSKDRIKFLAKLAACLGIALMLLSSTPFPSWFYLVFRTLFFGWIVSESITRFRSRSGILALRTLLIGSCLMMVVLEMPHRQLGQLPKVTHAQVYIVGDSISAGIDENPTWSEVFQKKYVVSVNNLAKPAATLSSARKQSDLVPAVDCLILLEIGGNDLLGKASCSDFEQDLRELLVSLEKPKRTLVMFELPLLPGQAALGRAQRTLAGEHGVYLIPKRYFCHVLGAPNATIDGLHLSPTGSSLMADMVHGIIGRLLIQNFSSLTSGPKTASFSPND